MKEVSPLSQLPEGWREEIVSEEDPRINPDSWRLGQAGMVGNVIKPIDQEGIERGKFRVIFINSQRVLKENPRDDLL